MVRPHMATHGPVTHLTSRRSRLLTLRWLARARHFARALATLPRRSYAYHTTHAAVRRTQISPGSRCSAQDLPAHRSPCMLHRTHLTLRSESARPGPDSRLTPHSASRLILSGGRSGLGIPRRLSLRPLAARFPRRVLLARCTGLLTRLRPGSGPTLHLFTHKARLDQARSLRSPPARPGPPTSLTLSPSMQANSTSRLHGARMARFVAPPPPTLLLLTSRCPHRRARPSSAQGRARPAHSQS